MDRIRIRCSITLTQICFTQNICSVDVIPSPTYMLLYVIMFSCILSYCITSLLYGFLCYVECFLFAQACVCVWVDDRLLHHVLMHCISTSLNAKIFIRASILFLFSSLLCFPGNISNISLIWLAPTALGQNTCRILCTHSNDKQVVSYVHACI